MPGIGLRRAKNIVGGDCIGIDETDGQFYIKFKIPITPSESYRISQLREACGEDSLQKKKGKGNDKKTYAVGKVPVSKDPRNDGSLELSKFYAKKD